MHFSLPRVVYICKGLVLLEVRLLGSAFACSSASRISGSADSCAHVAAANIGQYRKPDLSTLAETSAPCNNSEHTASRFLDWMAYNNGV